MAAPVFLGYHTYPPPPWVDGMFINITAKFSSSTPLTYQWWDSPPAPIPGAVYRSICYGPTGAVVPLLKCTATNADGITIPAFSFFGGTPPVTTALAIGDFIRTVYVCANGGQRSFTSMWWRCTAVGGSPSTDDDLGSYMDTNAGNNLIPWLAGNAAYKGVIVQIMKPTLQNPVYNVTSAGAGTGGTANIPGQVSGLVTYTSATGGRRGRGRSFWPFPDTNMQTALAQVSVAGLGLLNGQGTFASTVLNMAGGGRTATVRPIIYHRDTNTGTDITGSISRLEFATHRSRGALAKAEGSPLG